MLKCRFSKYINFIIVICSLAVVSLSGCGKDSRIILTTGFDEDELFRIDGLSCSRAEFMVYLTNIQDQYELAFGKKIWDADTGDMTLEQNLRQTVLARLAKIKMMNRMAENLNIELSSDEKKRAEKAAETYYSSLSPEEIEAMGGVNRKTITLMYNEYALACKLYDQLTADVDAEISDDEARTVTVMQIKAADRGTADSILRRLKDGESFDAIAMSESETDDMILSVAGDYEDENVRTACFALGEGELSNVVEGNDGYYIFSCLSTLDREQTDLKKEKIADERREAAFNDSYNSFAEGKRCYLNEELYEKIVFTGGGNVDTADFFDVYEKSF